MHIRASNPSKTKTCNDEQRSAISRLVAAQQWWEIGAVRKKKKQEDEMVMPTTAAAATTKESGSSFSNKARFSSKLPRNNRIVEGARTWEPGYA